MAEGTVLCHQEEKDVTEIYNLFYLLTGEKKLGHGDETESPWPPLISAFDLPFAFMSCPKTALALKKMMKGELTIRWKKKNTT